MPFKMGEVRRLAPIAVVMPFCSFVYAVWQRHLNGWRGARFQIVLSFRF